MTVVFTRSQIAAAVATVLSAATMAAATAKDAGEPSQSAAKPKGTYATGDFHNHTTCSDGAISMEKLVKKSTDKQDTPWGLDWFVQAGHGGSGNRNCTLVEDASLSTPAYPYVEGRGPSTTWANSIGTAAVKGNTGSSDGSSTTALASLPNPSMWRWQSIQEYQYPVTEYLSGLKNVPVFMGLESVVAGHEHTSMSVISGQIVGKKGGTVGAGGYVPVGDATALAKWSYCFDRGDTDNSRGGGQNWDCSVPGSDHSSPSNPDWRPTAAKIMPAGGAGSGVRGHLKTVEAMKWMAAYHPTTSYYVPAHLERAGPFNPDGNNGFNIEHLRNFNNAAPTVAFGMETQPGHGASDNRGEYSPDRNNIGGVRVDSVGGTTYGGTGVYGAQIGGVWDALLGEGRNWWFFASSDWHNRGSFAPDDRRTTQDFYPGEYQRDFVMVRDTEGKASDINTPQEIVDGLRSGNSWTASGQLIDRLTFVACAGERFKGAQGEAQLEVFALQAAMNRTDVNINNANCATMGEKLKIRMGEDVVVAVALRDPTGTNYSPYTFANPSLAQIGVNQPLNMPELSHVDLIRGYVKGYKQPGTPEYSGQWPDNWIDNQDMSTVPEGAKNTTAKVLHTFGPGKWKSKYGNGNDAFAGFKTMVFRIKGVADSQYVRLRGTNLPPAVPYETDANGNPLADIYTNASDPSKLTIPCTVRMSTPIPANTVYTGDSIDGCPDHLARYPEVTGPQYVSYDVAAWADLWFYSNPIFVEVKEGQIVAGVN
ncbi:hypothetical protein JM946_01025 [Steroidobacter sp. S1-65]|uniref:DUF3604 domain-containing protein n=1 Tax=Steroidobacter gossypii TaxID=2805490 RepID=A0ABS1WQP4_9GAMM|nr:hypothetical protein [Steroidobacter gossypii]MBM0103300.1 hypothetical protein [Steroidobacter gossypii]